MKCKMCKQIDKHSPGCPVINDPTPVAKAYIIGCHCEKCSPHEKCPLCGHEYPCPCPEPVVTPLPEEVSDTDGLEA